MLQVLARVQTSLQLPSRQRRQDGKKSSRYVSRVSASCVCVCVFMCVCVFLFVCLCVCDGVPLNCVDAMQRAE